MKYKVNVEKHSYHYTEVEVEAESSPEALKLAEDTVSVTPTKWMACDNTHNYVVTSVQRVADQLEKWVTYYLSQFELINPVRYDSNAFKRTRSGFGLNEEDLYALWLAVMKHNKHEKLTFTLEGGRNITEGESYFVIYKGKVIETVLDDASNPCEAGYDISMDNPEHFLDYPAKLRVHDEIKNQHERK